MKTYIFNLNCFLCAPQNAIAPEPLCDFLSITFLLGARILRRLFVYLTGLFVCALIHIHNYWFYLLHCNFQQCRRLQNRWTHISSCMCNCLLWNSQCMRGNAGSDGGDGKKSHTDLIYLVINCVIHSWIVTKVPIKVTCLSWCSRSCW